MMSRRKHGIFISAPHDGQVYVAERSRRGTPSSCTCSRRPTARVQHNLFQLSPHKSRPCGRIRRTGLMEYVAGIAGSLRLDVGRPDHLGPLVGLVGNEFSEFGGCQ